MPLNTFPFEAVAPAYAMDGLEPHLSADILNMNYREVYLRDLQYLNILLTYVCHLQTWNLSQLILFDIPNVPTPLKNAIKFYAGSVYNHGLFFDGLAPSRECGEPTGDLAHAILRRYGSLSEFQGIFLDATKNVLGSGWVWLNLELGGDIHIAYTKDNLSPQLSEIAPILTLDVWEHAYLSQFGLGLEDYVSSWFHVLDWNRADQRYCLFQQRAPEYRHSTFPSLDAAEPNNS